ncbi:M50 family metallopeptidase [Paenibacillus sp. MBLB2552]|uniref:M50 family metallopeptidase n=1 Tax=Paenibacillus mellifer TaxID=2937794 RepID=A0A9X1Y5J2_9BACL|nr:M50 family metallopeptidase [Paenibacillus mellifer]MCK8487717.1 M50 family metallopeptidase [Paenibacillus mellifer]
MNKWLKALLFLIGAAVLTRLIPFSDWFRMLDTMVHELGHAIVTLFASGQVLRIELHPDHSGVTYSVLASGWSQLAVSLAGYISASLFAIAMFFGYSRQNQAAGLVLISILALASLLLFVRSGYGRGWLILFVLINGAFFLLGGRIRNFYYLLLAFLCLEESVMGPVTLLLNSIVSPSQAGDATNLAQLTGVSPLVWSLIFLGISLICALSALQLYWNDRRRSREKKRMSGSSSISP